MKVCCGVTFCVLLVICLKSSSAQVPPRLQIPGAVLVQQARPSGFRQARIHQEPSLGPPPRQRRPIIQNAIPLPTREIKPVVEEEEEPSLPTTSSTFDEEVSKLGLNALQSAVRQAEEEDQEPPQLIAKPSPLPFRPERPIPVLRQDVRERSEPAPPRPLFRQDIPQQRPIPVHRHRQEQHHEEVRQPPQPVRQQARQQIPPPQPTQQVYRPQPRVAAPRPVQYEDDDRQRTRKPPVQILRKYRTDNPDGSITWGYENEDGSFKEETLGVDCVTRGKYGYVDPDGVRREYSYETGNKCDQPEEEEEELLPQGKQIIPHGRKPQGQHQQPQFRPQPQAY